MEIPLKSISANDMIIAIMGPSGSGKSHFIDVLRKSGARTGHPSSTLLVTGVRSFTVEHHKNNRPIRVVLIDVPAFGELETFTMVGKWLEKTYRRGVRLSGILYLHRISDNRIYAPDLKFLQIFEKLCGDATMSRITFVSTMWDKVDEIQGKNREDELKDRIWRPMLDRGSKIKKFDNSFTSAKNIVDSMTLNEEERITLLIQEELVSYGKQLNETHAAHILNRTLQESSSETKALVQRLKDQADKEDATKSPHVFQALKAEAEEAEKGLRKTLNDIQRLEHSPKRRFTVPFGWNKHKGKILPSAFPTTKDSGQRGASVPGIGTSNDRFDVYFQSYAMVSKMLGSSKCRGFLYNLTGAEAQSMVDFLYQLLCDQNLVEQGDKKYIRSLLSRLVQSSQVFPTQYKLEGVHYDPRQHPIYGGFSHIYKGEYRGHTVCIKVITVGGDEPNAQYLKVQARELVLWADLSHHNILPLYGYFTERDAPRRISIVSPWMQYGDLNCYLRKFPTTPRMPLISDVNAGLHYLHQQGIVHADLKAANVLVSDERKAMITDFGISRVFRHRFSFTETPADEIPLGTACWMAPELFFGAEYLRPTKGSDIWSFGCICYEVFVEKRPFHQYNSTYQMMKARLTTCPTPLLPDEANHFHPRMRKLMSRCWKEEPSRRPTCEEIKASLDQLKIVDDRLTTANEIESAFLQVKDIRPDVVIDYQLVHKVLYGIRQAQPLSEDPAFSEDDGPSHPVHPCIVTGLPGASAGPGTII